MKTSSKIAIAAAAVGAWLLAKKKGAISGIGAAGTRVVFRKFPDGEIIALFPDDKWDIDGREIASYMHDGQHGGASPELIRELKKATPKEYKDLYDELVMIGYDDLVIARGVGETKPKAKKYYVYAGYYELFISSEPMPAPYILQKTFRSIDRAIEYAESWGDSVVYCDNVKYDLPDWLYENLQDNDYEFFVPEIEVGKVDYSDFDGARIIAKDGSHAIEFNIYGGTGSGIVVSSVYKGKGKYGSIWEYLSHIGEYKTLSGAIKAAKKYWDEKGVKYNEKDFEKL